MFVYVWLRPSLTLVPPRYLLSQGASRDLLTAEGETAAELADPEDYRMLAVLRNTAVAQERDRRLSLRPEDQRREPLWLRRESLAAEAGGPVERRGSTLLLPPAGERRGSGLLLPALHGAHHETDSLLRDTFSVLRARKGSMYPRGRDVLEEEEDEEEEEEEEEEEDEEDDSVVIMEEVKESVKENVKENDCPVTPSSGRKPEEEDCDVAAAMARWKRRREERLER